MTREQLAQLKIGDAVKTANEDGIKVDAVVYKIWIRSITLKLIKGGMVVRNFQHVELNQ